MSRRNRRKHRGGSVVGSQVQSSQQQPINQEGEQSTQKQPNRVEQSHDSSPHQSSVAGASNSPPVVSEDLPRLAVGAQGQSSQPPTMKKEGEQSPQKQSNGAAQSHGLGSRQAPVTGASIPSPHILQNQPRSVGASNSHDQQNSARNIRGHHPAAFGQRETTETDDNGCSSCESGGTACLAGAFDGVRVLSHAEAIPCLMDMINFEHSKVKSLRIGLLNEQQKSRKIEKELLGERQKNMGLEGEKSNLLALGAQKDIQSLQDRVALRDRISAAGKKVQKMESERKALDIKLQDMGGQLREKGERENKVRVELEAAKSLVQQKEERERALIKEKEEEITKIKREHEEREGEMRTALIAMERKLCEKEERGKKVRVELEAAKSLVQQKEERERALIKEKEEEITKIKREHEEREGQIQTALIATERELYEKEERWKEVRVELEAAEGQVQQQEERERALIKEKEEAVSKIKREHEEREGEIEAVMTEMESQLREKEERERAIVTEREEISKIKREHEERERQLREKEKSGKKVETELGEAHEKIGRMKHNYELKLEEAKKRIDTLELKLSKLRAVMDEESEQTSDQMEWTSNIL